MEPGRARRHFGNAGSSDGSWTTSIVRTSTEHAPHATRRNRSRSPSGARDAPAPEVEHARTGRVPAGWVAEPGGRAAAAASPSALPGPDPVLSGAAERVSTRALSRTDTGLRGDAGRGVCRRGRGQGRRRVPEHAALDSALYACRRRRDTCCRHDVMERKLGPLRSTGGAPDIPHRSLPAVLAARSSAPHSGGHGPELRRRDPAALTSDAPRPLPHLPAAAATGVKDESAGERAAPRTPPRAFADVDGVLTDGFSASLVVRPTGVSQVRSASAGGLGMVAAGAPGRARQARPPRRRDSPHRASARACRAAAGRRAPGRLRQAVFERSCASRACSAPESPTGDDLNDLCVLTEVGLSAAPKDAPFGGAGALRVVTRPAAAGCPARVPEAILKARGQWEPLLAEIGAVLPWRGPRPRPAVDGHRPPRRPAGRDRGRGGRERGLAATCAAARDRAAFRASPLIQGLHCPRRRDSSGARHQPWATSRCSRQAGRGGGVPSHSATCCAEAGQVERAIRCTSRSSARPDLARAGGPTCSSLGTDFPQGRVPGPRHAHVRSPGRGPEDIHALIGMQEAARGPAPVARGLRAADARLSRLPQDGRQRRAHEHLQTEMGREGDAAGDRERGAERAFRTALSLDRRRLPAHLGLAAIYFAETGHLKAPPPSRGRGPRRCPERASTRLRDRLARGYAAAGEPSRFVALCERMHRPGSARLARSGSTWPATCARGGSA